MIRKTYTVIIRWGQRFRSAENRTISVPTEKGKTMTDREKLIGLLDIFGIDDDWYANTEIADYLLANGVTFTPAIPGPSEADPNIMELCFRNGENHMRDKIKQNLKLISADMPCVPTSQVIKIMEDIQ